MSNLRNIFKVVKPEVPKAWIRKSAIHTALANALRQRQPRPKIGHAVIEEPSGKLNTGGY